MSRTARSAKDDLIRPRADVVSGVSRVDLHVHSRYSDRPTEWVLRRIGAPECYTSPDAVYAIARRRGMSFVTISDHNCISGAAEIAHLPGVFVSNEITAYFPDDGCKVHVLAWDISEPQFNEIQRLRENNVDLRDYMHAEGIVHACAHPLYSINDRLTIGHFERLLLLFNVFEAMNGGRNRRGNDVVRSVLQHLTPEQFWDMASRHAIQPVGTAPWIKGMTGGSDDHSGVFVAKGYTECDRTDSYAEFLQHVQARHGRAKGLDGTPLSFAHSLYSIGYQYYRDRFTPKTSSSRDLMLRMFTDIFGRDQTHTGLKERVTYIARRLTRRPDPAELDFKRLISGEMVKLFGEDWLRDDFVVTPERYDELNRRTFALSSSIANQLFFQFSKKFVEKLSAGSIFGSIEALSALGPIALGIAPYLFSFAHQSRDKSFLADVETHFFGRTLRPSAPPRKAWFVDGDVAEVNGVTRLVEKMCQIAEGRRDDLTLISVADRPPAFPGRVQNFTPVGQFALPENANVNLAFPPFLEVLEYCERQDFTEIVVSTPGLAGLAAVAAAKILNVRLVGIYHTDLPQYIRYYTEDDSLESAAWRYLRWFYEQMDLIYVPSRAYRQQLIDKGFNPAKPRLFPHGIDVDRFNPRYRDTAFWERYGVNGGPKVTYVGRLAKEKDLDVLMDVYETLARRRPDCTLTVVGDGPFMPTLRARLNYPNVVFTGFLFGQELSTAYAASDVFVFPSTTDTFGNVVLEAMASGVPVVVSDKGGPSEIVQHGLTGFVTRARSAAHVTESVERLLDDGELRRQMSLACRSYAETCIWDRIYGDFWNGRDCEPTAAAPVSVLRPEMVLAKSV